MGGLIFLLYNLGNMNGRIVAHDEFVKNYGDIVFKKENKILTSLFKNVKVITLKKENV